jgi:hypothetical protein
MELSGNPSAEKLLEANPDKIDWANISANPGAINILKNNQHRRDLWKIASNPAIFEYDYELIKNTNKEKNLCVDAWFGQPRFIEAYINKYGIEALDEYMA